MRKITDLDSFKKYIKRISKAELDHIFDDLAAKCGQDGPPEYKLGYALMLDECVIEAQMRKANLLDVSNLSNDELLSELGYITQKDVD